MTMTKKTIADETYYRAGQVFGAMQDGPGGRKRAQQAARGLLRAALSCCKVTGLNPAPMIGASTGQAAPGVPTVLVTVEGGNAEVYTEDGARVVTVDYDNMKSGDYDKATITMLAKECREAARTARGATVRAALRGAASECLRQAARGNGGRA
jgi:hypothetical protein